MFVFSVPNPIIPKEIAPALPSAIASAFASASAFAFGFELKHIGWKGSPNKDYVNRFFLKELAKSFASKDWPPPPNGTSRTGGIRSLFALFWAILNLFH